MELKGTVFPGRSNTIKITYWPTFQTLLNQNLNKYNFPPLESGKDDAVNNPESTNQNAIILPQL
jgi:hypothetical protein